MNAREPMRPRLLALFLVVAIMAACSSDRPLGEIELPEGAIATNAGTKAPALGGSSAEVGGRCSAGLVLGTPAPLPP